MIELHLFFQYGNKEVLHLNDEEYDDLIDWLLEHPNDDDLVPFDVDDGKTVITFRPSEVKYMIKCV